jgi:hypothetical protein
MQTVTRRADGTPRSGRMRGMSLRTRPLEHEATLPDGQIVRVRVGIVEDSYIAALEPPADTLR